MSFIGATEESERNSPPLVKEDLMDFCLDKSGSDNIKYEIDDVLTSIRYNNTEQLSKIIGNQSDDVFSLV